MSDTHKCPAPPCQRQVPPAMFACKSHWFLLPKQVRDDIWDAHRAGTASEHIAAMAAAVRWYEENLCPDEPAPRYNITVTRPPLAATKRHIPMPDDTER